MGFGVSFAGLRRYHRFLVARPFSLLGRSISQTRCPSVLSALFAPFLELVPRLLILLELLAQSPRQYRISSRFILAGLRIYSNRLVHHFGRSSFACTEKLVLSPKQRLVLPFCIALARSLGRLCRK